MYRSQIRDNGIRNKQLYYFEIYSEQFLVFFLSLSSDNLKKQLSGPLMRMIKKDDYSYEK